MRNLTVVIGVIAIGVGSVSAAAQEPLRKPYQVTGNSTCGGTSPSCGVSFPAVTARTLVKRVSCTFEITGGTTVDFAQLINFDPTAAGDPVLARHALQPFLYNIYGGQAEFGLSSDTYMYFEAGQIPQVVIDALNESVAGIDCTLFGDS